MFNIFRKDLTVKRKTAGSYVNGFWVAGTDTTLTIKASVQPLSGKDIELLPEGKRLAGGYKLFTNDSLKVAIEGTGQDGDIVSIYGFDYEVVSVPATQKPFT
jgi:hypothetical protein